MKYGIGTLDTSTFGPAGTDTMEGKTISSLMAGAGGSGAGAGAGAGSGAGSASGEKTLTQKEKIWKFWSDTYKRPNNDCKRDAFFPSGPSAADIVK